MFCQNCGKPTEGDQVLCPDCAAEKTREFHEATPTQQEQPIADTFELNTATPQSPAPSKKKIGLIAGIAALAVVLAALIGIVLNLDSIKALYSRNALSPAEYLQEVENKAFDEYTAELSQVYSQYLETFSTQHTAGQANIGVTLGDKVLSLAEMALQAQGMEMELDWLQDISLATQFNTQDDTYQANIGLGLGDNHLVSVDLIFDMANAMLYLAAPELSSTYLSGDFSDTLPADEMTTIMKQTTDAMRDLAAAMPTEAELTGMLNSYVKLVLSQIQNVEKKTESITVNGITQEVVVLTAKVTSAEITDIAEKILAQAKTDATLKKIICAFSDYVNTVSTMNGLDETLDLYQEFSDALAEITLSKDDVSEEDYLLLDVYVDMQSNLRGHRLTVYSDGVAEELPIYILSVVEDGITHTEIALGSAYITGESTEQKDVLQGSYSLSVEDQAVMTVELKDVTETSGTIRLIPSEEILNMLLAENELVSVLNGNIALEVSVDTQNELPAFAVRILADTELLIGLRVSSALSNSTAITVPTDTLDLTDENNLIQWLTTLDFTQVMDNMEKANVPQELMEIVANLEEMLQYELATYMQ